MKILIITNLFPNSKEPTRGMYNKQQFLELAKLCELKVVAPLPWYYRHDIPKGEVIDDIDTYHPRYFMIPKVGRSLYGLFFYLSLRKFVKKIQKDFKFDLIFATWAYPDGFGSFLIAKVLKKPIVIKVHGSDINIYAKYFLRRKMISYALRNSNKVIAVTKALKEEMVKIGVPEDKIAVIPNGVDTNIFKPIDMQICRKKLGLPLDKIIILFIGNLVPVKGLSYLLDAFKQIVSNKSLNLHLIILGDGPLKEKLRKEVEVKRIDKMVDFVNTKAHSEIPLWMNASNLFCLPSLNEGCPNVVLEALACSKPVVATNVGGLPELINSEDYGILVKSKNSIELAQGIQDTLEKDSNPYKLCQRILGRNWETNAKETFRILSSAIKKNSEKLDKKGQIKRYTKELLSSVIPNRWIIWQGNGRFESNRIALTFDDGPNPQYTPQLLDMLNEHKIKATFFLIGENVERYQNLAKRILNEKHCVGNHSYSHKKFMYLNSIEIEKEILKTQQILKDILGHTTHLFRPPNLKLQVNSLIVSRKLNLTTVLCSLDSLDYKKINKEAILQRLNSNMVKARDIILFHDDNEFTLDALPLIIKSLRDKGYSFVTIDEFLSNRS